VGDMAVTNKSYADMFLALLSDDVPEPGLECDPYEFVLKLWETDRSACIDLFRTCLIGKERRLFARGGDCLCEVALIIRSEEIREVLDEAVLRGRGKFRMGQRIAATAFLLGSRKLLGAFAKEFERTFVCGLESLKYDDFITARYLRIMALLGLKSLYPSVERLLGRKDEQFHRVRASKSRRAARRMGSCRWEARLQRRDCSAIKFAEAVRDYFDGGSARLKQYLDSLDDSEERAFQYLYCLACAGNPGEFNYFREFYTSHKDFRLRNICLEAVVYLGPSDRAAAFINEQLETFDFSKVLSKRGHDFGVLRIWAQDWRFYVLLESCYYLDRLGAGLVEKLRLFATARDTETSSVAKIILNKFHPGEFEQRTIDSATASLFKTSESAAGLLSLAKEAGILKR